MNTIQTLEAMEAAPQGSARLEILAKNDSPNLRRLLVLALSPQVTFGVKKLPAYEDRQCELAEDFDAALFRLLEQLKSRELSGNAAQEAIGTFLKLCDPTEAKWAIRVIKQDLRLNIGAKEVNNTLGEGTIFQFAVALAEDFAKVEPKHYAGRWSVQPKLDGARTVAILPANRGPVVLLSRSGKEYKNFESVRTMLQKINDRRNPVNTLFLDGEVVSYVNERVDFQALQHTLFRKDGAESGRLRYLIFDGAYEAEWRNPQQTYAQRYEHTSKFVAEQLDAVVGSVTRIGMVPQHVTIDPDRNRMLLNSRQFVEQGYEGAMFRKADEPVQLKRSRSLLKVKSFLDAEADLVGVVPGTGKFDHSLGALKCRTKDGKEFEIGSGFTDEQRKVFWKTKDELPPTLTFKYQELTDAGIPRFPIFKGFRSNLDS